MSMEDYLIFGFVVYGFIAIVLICLVAYLVMFFISRRSEKEWNSDHSLNENKKSEVHLIKNNRQDTQSLPKRPETRGKRRSYYGDKVCGHDRNYEKTALKSYLSGHYYFFYHNKKYRTPELWS